MRIKAYLGKQHFVMMFKLPVLSLLFACIEQILLKKAFLLPIATRSAEFDDFKIMWLAYEVTFASVFLSCSQNNV